MQRVGLATISYWSKKNPIMVSDEILTIDTFYDMLYNYMKPSIDAADAGRNFDWKRLEKGVEKFKKYLNRDVLKYIFAMFAFALCEEYKNVYNVGVKEYLDLFINSAILWIDHPTYTPYLIGFCENYTNYDIYKLRRMLTNSYEVPVVSWSADPLLRAYMTGDLLSTKILIKYGIVFHLPTDNNNEYNIGEIVLLRLGFQNHVLHHQAGISWVYPQLLWAENGLRTAQDLLRTEFIDRTTFREDVKFHYPTPYERRRMFFVIRALYVLSELSKGNPRYLSLVEPLRLMFQTTPEPYVTVGEIRRLLNAMGKDVRPGRVDFLCNRYAECFGESRLPFRPRSLKHLSRWRVRETLRRVHKLPHGVSRLEIPQYLQRYILIMEDSRSNHHICYFDSNKVPEYPGGFHRRRSIFARSYD